MKAITILLLMIFSVSCASKQKYCDLVDDTEQEEQVEESMD